MSGLIAVGVSKQLIIAKETTFATAALNTSGQLMRRVTSNVDLSKKTYKSTEIRPDYQFSDFRHGTRSVTGTISDELSVGTWNQFMASVMRQAWQKPGVTAATSITAEVAGPQFTRVGGSFLTDGFMVLPFVYPEPSLRVMSPRLQWLPAEPSEPGKRFRAALEALAYLIALGVRERDPSAAVP